MIPIIRFGIIVIITVILTAGIAGVVAFTVTNLRKSNIDDAEDTL